MWVKSLVTGKLRKVGDTFLDRQPKPYVANGQKWDNGEYVKSDGPAPKEVNPAAKKIIETAKTPEPVKSETPAAPIAPDEVIAEPAV